MSSSTQASSRAGVFGAGVLFVLSLILGASWWAIMLSRGVIARAPNVTLALLVGLGLLQLVATGLVLVLIRSGHRSDSRALVSPLELVAFLLLLGGGLFYFTPAVGAPFLVVVVLLSGVALVRNREENAD